MVIELAIRCGGSDPVHGVVEQSAGEHVVDHNNAGLVDENGECKHGLTLETCGVCNGSLAKKVSGAGSGSGAGPATRPEPMHLLVKWSPEREADTLDRHRRVAEEHGTTWWGCETADRDRRVAPARLEILDRQLRASVPTSVFLYRLGDSMADAQVVEARLVAASGDGVGIDLTRRPAGYEDSQCFVYLELADFTPLAPGEAVASLELYDQAKPLDAGALGNQTSPLYVARTVGGADAE